MEGSVASSHVTPPSLSLLWSLPPPASSSSPDPDQSGWKRSFAGGDAASSGDQERPGGSVNPPPPAGPASSPPPRRAPSPHRIPVRRRLEQHHLLLFLTMVSRLVLYLLSACLLLPLHLPEARASFHPQSAECRGRKECSGRAAGARGARPPWARHHTCG